MDYAKEYPVAMKAIAEWIEKGLLERKFHIVNGLDAAPSALPLLYNGGNTGKLCALPSALTELVTYPTLLELLRFPSMKSQLSFELRVNLRAATRLLISIGLMYHSTPIMIFTCCA